MTIGTVLTEVVEYYRRSWREYMLLSGLVFVPLGVLMAIAQHTRTDGDVTMRYVWGVISTVAMIVASSWLQTAVILRCEEQRNGRPLPGLAELYRRATPYLVPVLSVAVAASAVFWALSLLGVLAIPFLIFLLTRWIIVMPIVVLEGMPLRGIWRRSNAVAKGRFFDLLLLSLLSVVVLAVTYLAGGAILSPVTRFGQTWFATVFVGTIAIPPVMLAATVAYFQLSRSRPVPLA